MVSKQSPLPTDRHITYMLQYRTCGKPWCVSCPKGEPWLGHGPYWYAYWWEGNGPMRRLRSAYVGKQEPAGITPHQRAQAQAGAERHVERYVLAGIDEGSPLCDG